MMNLYSINQLIDQTKTKQNNNKAKNKECIILY